MGGVEDGFEVRSRTGPLEGNWKVFSGRGRDLRTVGISK